MRPVVATLGLLFSAACPASNEPTIDEPCLPGDPACPRTCDQFRPVGDFELCTATTDTGYSVVARYTGAGTIDVDQTELRIAGDDVPASQGFDAATSTWTLTAHDLAPGKYSVLLRARTTTGDRPRALFAPLWIGQGGYADFGWKDAILYQILTDRFRDGDSRNNLDNGVGDLARVDDPRSRWQGGDFAGITAKLREGYFDALGVNTLWISSPIINSHNSQPSVGLSDPRRFASYHSYHPIATGYTDRDDLGYATPIEPAFGTAAELHELVREAHVRGMRVIPDFVVNHVHKEARLYADHPGWFFGYNACDNRWDVARIGCWFTTDMPDFDYGGHPDAVRAVVDHALWMIQEFDLDGFRADALKHMDDVFVRALKAAVVAEIETTVQHHELSEEPTVFYMVGESLGGWARYHVRPDMVQGQVDEGYYNQTKASLLTFGASMRNLADFAIGNDTAYLTPQDTQGGRGGYPGAIMGNFFGNHDQVRALTEARNNGGGHERLRLALTFLFTSPGNIPMLYQGDDIGTEGGPDPDNRKMQRFDGLSTDELATLAHARKAGTLRAEHPALRRGVRTNVVVEDWYWVYKVSNGSEDVFVAINRDNPKSWSPPPGYVDGLGNCAGGTVPTLSSCIFVKP
jgi:glycosidase